MWGGVNLYNNGFSGGLIAIVLYPTITAIARKRRPTLQNEDYYDLFEESAPIDTSDLSTTHGETAPEEPPENEALEAWARKNFLGPE